MCASPAHAPADGAELVAHFLASFLNPVMLIARVCVRGRGASLRACTWLVSGLAAVCLTACAGWRWRGVMLSE